MNESSEAALDDIRRRLDQLHSDVQVMTAYGRVAVAALADLSADSRRAVAGALAEEAAALGLSGDAGAQADLFAASAGVDGAGAPEARLARRLERALVEQAAALGEDGEPPLRRFG